MFQPTAAILIRPCTDLPACTDLLGEAVGIRQTGPELAARNQTNVNTSVASAGLKVRAHGGGSVGGLRLQALPETTRQWGRDVM